MKNFIVIKSQDRGGSYFIKNELLPKFQGRENYIYDINKEYTMFKNEVCGHYKELPSKSEFLDLVPCVTDSYVNVVFEEATSFFPRQGAGESKILEHVTRRFHSKNLNIFVFHSLLKIPTDIHDYMDFIILFRTKDDPEEVRKKFKSYPEIIEAFNDVREKTENTFFNRLKGTYPDEHSKKFFHYKRVIAKE